MEASSTKFRRATLADLESVCESLIALNRKVADAYPTLPMRGQDIALTAAHVIQYGICLIGHGAVAGGDLKPWLYNRTLVIGNVIFWNFQSPQGVHILEAIAEEFRKNGASHVAVASHPPDDRAARIYKRLGFIGAENQWLLDLSKNPCQNQETGVSQR